MAAFQIKVNGQSHSVDALPDTPLLWVIRDKIGLTGTKFGCGVAQCGACTVFLDGKPLRSCSLPVSAVGGGEIVTIEGARRQGSARPCSAPGPRATCRNAATASPAR